MSYSIDPLTADCYPGTSVLINKLDIRDEAALASAEVEIVTVRTAQWLLEPLAGTFDFSHYKAIHGHLFGDLYDWAGQIRTVNLSQKGTRFCPAGQIEERAAAIFSRLKTLHYLSGMEAEPLVEEFTDLYCSTNELHPFREGNGRTQRVFLAQLIQAAGYELNFSDVDGDLLMLATIQAAQGVTDLLKQIFSDTIHKR